MAFSMIESWMKSSEISRITWVSPQLISYWRKNTNDRHQELDMKEPCYVEECTFEDDTEFLEPYEDGDEDNVLVIWDIHEPVCLEGYYEFIRETQERFDCGTVIFIWDVADFNWISYHEKDPNLNWIKVELEMAIEALQKWYYTFPNAIVLEWNHDALPERKGKSCWLTREMLRTTPEILQFPEGWEYEKEVIINDVLYTHWTKWTALRKAISNRISLVQWHLHTEAFVIYQQWFRDSIFWMQVWCWIDNSKPEFDYNKSYANTPIISCGVVLDSWTLPLVIRM